jgi:hypothetical protein
MLFGGMNTQRNTLRAELKSTRQIVVRFIHAPCVKLTLQPRPASTAAPAATRILRLRDEESSARD